MDRTGRLLDRPVLQHRFKGAGQIGAVRRHDIGTVILAGVIQQGDLLNGVRRTELRGETLALRAVIVDLVERAALRGRGPGGHRHRPDAAATQVGLAGGRGQQAAVRADFHADHPSGRHVKGLVLLLIGDLLHDLIPHGCGRVAGIADALVLIVTAPDRCGIVWSVAHEIAVVVFAGGARLSGAGHAGEPVARGGAAVHNALKKLVHKVGGGLLHGHMGVRLVVEDHIAVGILHLRIEPWGIVHAAVGEHRVGRGHLLGGNAVGQAAQTHGRRVDIIGHQIQIHLLRGEGERIGDAQLLHHLNGHGVDGVGHAGGEGGPAAVARRGVLGPRPVVEQADGIIVKGGRHGDDARVQRGSVHRDGLDGRAALPGAGGVVPAEVAVLHAHLAHHGHHVAGGRLHDGDAGLKLLSAGRGHVQVGAVLIDRLGQLLNVGVNGGVNGVAAVVELDAGLLGGDPVLLGKVGGHVHDDLIHKVGIDARGGRAAVLLRIVGGHQLLCGDGAVGKMQLLVDRLLILLLGEIALLAHLAEDVLLAVLVHLPGRPLLAVGIRDGHGGHRSVQRGVVGDGDDAGALRR